MVAYAIWATNSKSEVKFDLRGCSGHLEPIFVCCENFQAPEISSNEATAASKWPHSSNFTSDLEFVAQIAYATMFVWAVKAFFGSITEQD